MPVNNWVFNFIETNIYIFFQLTASAAIPNGATENYSAVLQQNAYNGFKNMVLEFATTGEDEAQRTPINIPVRQIRPQKYGGVLSIDSFKKYEPVCGKGVLINDYELVPFGYKKY
jgi:hypothetical protein